MCGILGAIGPAPHWRERVSELLGSLAHRGPDGSRVAGGPGYAFGHTLLSIIGAEPVRQPIVSSTGDVTLTYNGEIYNYRELAAEDAALRAHCPEVTDTHVLVEGLTLYGTAFIERLNGMFAFAYFDRRSGDAVLVRDRLGVKPLLYAETDDALLFASESVALRRLAGLEHAWDPVALYSWARFRYPLGGRAFHPAMRALEPGAILHVTPDGRAAAPRRYWTIPDPQPLHVARVEDVADEVEALLQDTVRMQTRSDHSFCTFLSGGLDSSLLSALARTEIRSLDTYSIALDDAVLDESRFAVEVAAALGTRHHPLRLDAATYRAAHARHVAHLEEPIGVPNQVALEVLATELSKRHRCVLSGEGADEVFGGYGRIFLLHDDWLRLEQARREPTPAGQRLLDSIERRFGTTRFDDFTAFFVERYGYMSHAQAHSLLSDRVEPGVVDAACEQLTTWIRERFESWNAPPDARLLMLFQSIHLPGLLLRLDRATMAHGVEARVPFLDHRLVELMNRVPISVRMPRGPGFASARAAGASGDELSEVHDVPKAVLKHIARKQLPSSIVDRRKLGFPMPTSFAAPDGFPARNLALLDAAAGRVAS